MRSRWSRGWPLAVAVLSLSSSVSWPTRAQPSAEEDPHKAEARAHFERGLELSEDQAWDAAYAEYAASISVFPTKAATKNAALCLRMLHRYAEALEMLERMLVFSNLNDADRAFADREMHDVKRFVGTIVIHASDSDALVSVDGGARGRTPLPGPLRATAGSHVVRLFKPGSAPFEQEIVLAGGQTLTVDARLEAIAQTGRLRVVSQAGAGAQVLVDGAAVGPAPWEGPVGVGQHTAALKGDGVLGAQPVSVPVRLNELATITLALEPLDGQLRIEPTPANAVTAIDGVTLGRGVWEGPLRLGDHRVEVAAEGFLPSQQTVNLEKSSRRVVSVQLERDLSSPLWTAQHPPHLFLGAEAALMGFPSLGGDLSSGCSAGCSSGFALGVLGELRAGYELSSGLGFSIDGGYAWVQQTISGRPDALQPLPLGSAASDPGTSTDKLTVQGPLVTASASYHRGERFTWLARVAVGAWFSTVSDTRTGSYTTVRSEHPDHTLGAPVTYSVGPLTQSAGTIFGVLVPEFRVGWQLGKAELGAGLKTMLALPLSSPQWQAGGAQTLTGNCGANPVPTCVSDGLAQYGQTGLTGSVVVLVGPVISVDYSL
jgi:hypothetical protein